MEGSVIDLSRYRYETAKADLDTAKVMFKAEKYKAAVNRLYYAIFHALRSVIALDGFDSSKHSGVIAYFNKNYVKNKIFEKDISKKIEKAFRLREKADYQDFFVISKAQVEEQIQKAEQVIDMIEPYLKIRWKK